MGIELPAEAEVLFEKHAALLEEWNQQLNLTRIPKEEMGDKHFLDSLSVLLVPQVKGSMGINRYWERSWFSRHSVESACPNMEITPGGFFRKTYKILESCSRELGP